MFIKGRPVKATPADIAFQGRPLTQPAGVDITRFYWFNGTVQTGTYLPFPPGYDPTIHGLTTFGRTSRPLRGQRVLALQSSATKMLEAETDSVHWIGLFGEQIDVIVINTGVGEQYVFDMSEFIGNTTPSTFSGQAFMFGLCDVSTYANAAPPDANYVIDRALLVATVPTTTKFKPYVELDSIDPNELAAFAYALGDLGAYGFTQGMPTDAQIRAFFDL